MPVMIDVSPKIKKWVSEYLFSSNLEFDQIMELQSWFEKSEPFPFKKIEDISKKTKIPLGYFFLVEPPSENISLFASRTLKSSAIEKPSRNLMDTIYHMLNVQDWMKEHQAESGFSPLSFVCSINPEDDFHAVVRSVLNILAIEENWYEEHRGADVAYRFLKKKAQDSGIVVMESGVVGTNTHRPLSLDEFRAFVLIDEYAPLIFINSNDTKTGKLFSLIHEIVHIGLGTENLLNVGVEESYSKNKDEVFCNKVAGEIMVPTGHFLDAWHHNSFRDTLEIIENLSRKFNSSKLVIARKALDNRLIHKSVYQHVADESESFVENRKKQSRGSYYNTKQAQIDHRFLNALVGSVWEGKTLYKDAFSLTKTTAKSFHGLVECLKGKGAI